MKFLLSLLLLLQVVYGVNFVYPNFKQIYNRNIKSIVYFGKIEAIAVSKHDAISYLKHEPNHPYIKHDPFLGLYLFHTTKTLQPIKFKDSNKLTLGTWLASIGPHSLYIGNFAQRGSGIDNLYSLGTTVKPNDMMTCLCYKVYGLGVGDGQFIPSKLITHFIKAKRIHYGSIGARFKQIGEKVVVLFVNPFYLDNKLQVGDIIKTVDGKKINTVAQLEHYILFSPEAKRVTVKLMREGIKKNEKLKISERQGGGLLSDTFLECKGIYFDPRLRIINLRSKSFAAKYGLKAGDRLLEIDGHPVKNQNDVKAYLSHVHKKEIHLLIDRNDFQFFVKVNL